MDPWHPGLTALFHALDRVGVQWCLLRLPAVPTRPRGDIDLLVSPSGRAPFARIAHAYGFAQIPNGGTPDAFFLRYDLNTDCWLWLHVTESIMFGPRHRAVLSAEPVLDRRRRRDPVWLPQHDDYFWLLFLHIVLDKDEVAPRDLERLRSAAAHELGDGPVAAAARATANLPSAAEVVAALQLADSECAAYLESLRAGIGAQRVAAARSDYRERARSWTRLLRGWRNPWRRRGVTVAVLGPDGAGKSTLAAGLADSFFLPAQQMYMEVRDDVLRRLMPIRIPGLVFATYLLALWKRIVVARILQARGRLVVFDRYPYHALLAPDAPESLKHRIARQVLAAGVPRARLALVLDLPGEEMFRRKGERSPEELESERQALAGLAARVRGVQILDATAPADVVRREATASIWGVYAARWGSR